MKREKKLSILLIACLMLFSLLSCNNNSNNKSDESKVVIKDTSEVATTDTSILNKTSENKTDNAVDNEVKSTILIYNFYVTNRCVSCIAIEDATTKTLNTYFAKEVKQGRIKRMILNVEIGRAHV